MRVSLRSSTDLDKQFASQKNHVMSRTKGIYANNIWRGTRPQKTKPKKRKMLLQHKDKDRGRGGRRGMTYPEVRIIDACKKISTHSIKQSCQGERLRNQLLVLYRLILSFKYVLLHIYIEREQSHTCQPPTAPQLQAAAHSALGCRTGFSEWSPRSCSSCLRALPLLDTRLVVGYSVAY